MRGKLFRCSPLRSILCLVLRLSVDFSYTISGIAISALGAPYKNITGNKHNVIYTQGTLNGSFEENYNPYLYSFCQNSMSKFLTLIAQPERAEFVSN